MKNSYIKDQTALEVAYKELEKCKNHDNENFIEALVDGGVLSGPHSNQAYEELSQTFLKAPQPYDPKHIVCVLSNFLYNAPPQNSIQLLKDMVESDVFTSAIQENPKLICKVLFTYEGVPADYLWGGTNSILKSGCSRKMNAAPKMAEILLNNPLIQKELIKDSSLFLGNITDHNDPIGAATQLIRRDSQKKTQAVKDLKSAFNTVRNLLQIEAFNLDEKSFKRSGVSYRITEGEELETYAAIKTAYRIAKYLTTDQNIEEIKKIFHDVVKPQNKKSQRAWEIVEKFSDRNTKYMAIEKYRNDEEFIRAVFSMPSTYRKIEINYQLGKKGAPTIEIAQKSENKNSSAAPAPQA